MISPITLYRARHAAHWARAAVDWLRTAERWDAMGGPSWTRGYGHAIDVHARCVRNARAHHAHAEARR